MHPRSSIPASSGEPAPSSPRVFAAIRELAREEPVTVTVRGDCMAPLLADGERVEVAPARRYWPGDVVALRAADGRLLVHRLLGYRWRAGRLLYVTRGDRCPAVDVPVPLADLLGRVASPRSLSPPAARLRAVLAFLRLVARRLGRPSPP
jgi:hypothetical protein